MNCPFCKKQLPKSNPRSCPSCKKDLTNFYRMKNTQPGGQAETARKKNRLLWIILAAVLVCGLIVGAVLLFSGLGKEKSEPVAVDMEAVKAEIDSMQVSDFELSEETTDYVLLTVTDYGQIVVRLRPDIAPISAQNFKDLVADHYYDGTSFGRVIPNFMIQGGFDKASTTPIKGEFKDNGVENNLLHVRGVLSMARGTDMDSGSSQFFLMHADYPSLDGRYAAFGYIVAGLSTVDRVCEVPLGVNPNGIDSVASVPLYDVIIESAVFVTPKK